MPDVSLMCLGIGTGSSYTMRAITSTGFALLVDGAPYLLIDCGLGIALACQKHFGYTRVGAHHAQPRRPYWRPTHGDVLHAEATALLWSP